jgi:hypothetical protein
MSAGVFVLFVGGAALSSFSGKMKQHVNVSILAFYFQVNG